MSTADRGQQAQALHDEGVGLYDEGREDAAMQKYLQALALDFSRADTNYNIGLIYKYRGAWPESFKYNKRALALQPDDEATRWNLAIAATALRDWKTARAVWATCGMGIEPGDAEIIDNFGTSPVRLDPEGETEVVWAQRLCPVRARILNIPFPDSGFAWGDVVLHDGAEVGTRLDANGQERSVFNVLELFEPSVHGTWVVEVEAAEPVDVAALAARCKESRAYLEDWGESVRVLCRACSEGRAHEQHDHEGGATAWNPSRRLGVAGCSEVQLDAILRAWAAEGRVVNDWGLGLERIFEP